MPKRDTGLGEHSTSSRPRRSVAPKIQGTVDNWDRSAGEGFVTDEDGAYFLVVGADIDSPEISEGDYVKFDVIRDSGGKERAKRVIVQQPSESDSSDTLTESGGRTGALLKNRDGS